MLRGGHKTPSESKLHPMGSKLSVHQIPFSALQKPKSILKYATHLL